MGYMKMAVVILISGLMVGTLSFGQDDFNTSPKATSTQKHKKKEPKRLHSNYYRTKPIHSTQNVPAGVTTSLPTKRQVASESVMASSLTGESRFGTETILPERERRKDIHASLEFASNSIAPEDLHLGNNYASVLSLKPRLVDDITPDFSIYGTIPLVHYTPRGVSEFDVVNRPEVGVFTEFFKNEYVSLGAGVSAKLPYYDQGNSDLFAEPMRVWEFAPGVTVDYVIPDTVTHFVGTAKMTYNTRAAFSRAAVDPSGASVVEDGFERPLAIGASIGVTHEAETFNVGIALHTFNQLSPSKLTSGSTVVREVSPLSLLRGEFFGAYHFTPKTMATASLSRGIRTANDSGSYVAFDVPEDVSETSFTLGLAQVF